MNALVVLLAVVVAILTVLVIGLLRSHAEILRALHDAGVRLDPDHPDQPSVQRSANDTAPQIRTEPGVPEPRQSVTSETVSSQRAVDLVGTTPGGATKSIAVTGTQHRTLLAFLTSGCSTCAGFWEAFAEGVDLPADTRLVALTQGPDAESPSEVDRLKPAGLPVLMSTEAWNAYSVPVAPYFVLVDGVSGTVVGEGAAATWERVVALLGKALADSGHAPTYTRRDLLSGRDRRDRVDRELTDAGIRPNDPRLYHDKLPVEDGEP